MAARTSDGSTPIFYAAQFFYGGWFLFHGLNYWLHYFPERSFAPGAHGFIPEMIKLHLFDIVKLLEIVIGVALLADRFVPLAIVAAFPLTLVIALLNFSKGDLFGTCVGTIIIALNAVMALGHLDRYLPLLAMDAGAPNSRGLAAWRGGGKVSPPTPGRLRPTTQLVAIVLGIAVPAALTYASIRFAHPPAKAASVAPA